MTRKVRKVRKVRKEGNLQYVVSQLSAFLGFLPFQPIFHINRDFMPGATRKELLGLSRGVMENLRIYPQPKAKESLLSNKFTGGKNGKSSTN